MSLWDLGVAEGSLVVAILLGIALHSAFPNAGKPQIARNCFWAAWVIFAGLEVMWGIMTGEYSLWPRLLIVGFLSAIAGVGIVECARFIMHKENPIKVTVTAPVPFEGQGGKGGDAKVGGSGIAIGGPGGAAGKYGRGGGGGGGEVAGNGIAAGGEGGAAGDDNVWRPPARSGYEVLMERTGQTPDPFMKQFGRGGADGGYGAKLEVIERLRSEYFRSHSIRPESVSENINAVPLDHLNQTLEAMHEAWRARIINGQYEFFIPTASTR